MLAWCLQETHYFSIYWLAGHAGTGKSTIAKTLCEQLALHTNVLVATFFVSKDSAERRNPLRILHTFACELAASDVVIRQHVIAGIRSHTDIKVRPVKEQVEKLLVNAFEEIMGLHQIVLVIDALDECYTINGIEGGTLAKVPVRLVVTSRMEHGLQRMFASLPAQTVHLHEIENAHLESDVRMILKTGFEKTAIKQSISASSWPSEKDLDILIERTGRLLIFAATVIKFVDNDRFSAERRLRDILQRSSESNAGNAFASVDQLYLNVLETASCQDQESMNVDMALSLRVRNLLGTLLLLQEPPSIATLAQLIDQPQDEVEQDVRSLSAVLLVISDNNNPRAAIVRIFHPSFREFLLERCDDSRFSINARRQQYSLSVRCLHILTVSLKYDICDIRNPTITHCEIAWPKLSVRIQKRISGATQYATQFWIKHILHWIELVGILEKIPYIMSHLLETIGWMKVGS
jgi:hypothetical protein